MNKFGAGWFGWVGSFLVELGRVVRVRLRDRVGTVRVRSGPVTSFLAGPGRVVSGRSVRSGRLCGRVGSFGSSSLGSGWFVSVRVKSGRFVRVGSVWFGSGRVVWVRVRSGRVESGRVVSGRVVRFGSSRVDSTRTRSFSSIHFGQPEVHRAVSPSGLQR